MIMACLELFDHLDLIITPLLIFFMDDKICVNNDSWHIPSETVDNALLSTVLFVLSID